ncbi:MAG TPA: ABC transporter substrate-binding protein [Rhodospirillales bacterium]|nr:ABC transporter substrate-binding protein [Rhodospirillales bacterium]
MLQVGPSTEAMAAACPAVTVAKDMGIKGAYPQQFELAEFQSIAKCKLSFSENPDIAKLNSRIIGNSSLPPLAERLPDEPLVVAPYDAIGKYGGVFNMISNNTEAGTSDMLSVRHVNLVRYSDDLTTIVPNVAKGWKWNDDFTQLTFFLRKGHKWSDGAPFTADDIVFWYNNLNMDKNVFEKPKSFMLAGGKPMKVEALDPQTVRFTMETPYPGLLSHFASHYAQAFQPKHFLGRFHPDINPDADKVAQAAGFKTGYEMLLFYYGSSDWADVPSPMLKDPSRLSKLPANIQPTLASYITVTDTTEGRHYVANPYFFMVDTAGNQLPYISEQDELYINDNEVRILKAINGEYDYKYQSLTLPDAPILLDNQKKGDYTVELIPPISSSAIGINITPADEEKRKVFGNIKFRQALSVAMNRDEINEVAYYGLGKAIQYTGFSPVPDFVDPKWQNYFIKYDPALAKKLLDEIGVVDKDGDGFRDLLDGSKLVLNIQYATQGIPSAVVELIAQQWNNVGVKTIFKEVTPDEYRSAQSANELDVISWIKSQPLAINLGNNDLFLAPFGTYFEATNGLLWKQYIDSNGASGLKPPAFVGTLKDGINELQAAVAGTPESNAAVNKLVSTMAENLMFFGIVLAPGPVYHRNALKNFPTFKTASYEFYRTYPYRGPQWYLDE